MAETKQPRPEPKAKPAVGESWSDTAKAQADKLTGSTKAAAAKAGETTRQAGNKTSESARYASERMSSGARAVGSAMKKHPYRTAAAVGGVAAAAGAVAGKMYYGKRKAAKESADKVASPQMRAGEPKVKPSAD